MWMRAGHIWSNLSFPAKTPQGTVEWRKAPDLGRLFAHFPARWPYGNPDERPWLDTHDGRRIQAPASVEYWLRNESMLILEDGAEKQSDTGWDEYTFLEPLLALSALTLDGGWPVADVREPWDAEVAPGEQAFLTLLDGESPTKPLVIPYAGELREVLAAEFVRQSINRDHPLVRLALEAQYKARLTEVERFAESLVRYATDSGDFYNAVAEGYPTAQNELRYLGAMFRAVDWDSIDEKYHPPYQLWSRGRGFDSITEDRLIKWSKFEPRYR